MIITGRRKSFTFIPLESWRQQAACVEQVHEQLWDDKVDGEREEHRNERHRRAKAICRRCEVKVPCRQEVVLGVDEGIRGGEVLPPARDD